MGIGQRERHRHTVFRREDIVHTNATVRQSRGQNRPFGIAPPLLTCAMNEHVWGHQLLYLSNLQRLEDLYRESLIRLQ
jgi:hypothetical protein